MKKLTSLFLAALMLLTLLALGACEQKPQTSVDAPFEFISGGKVVGVDIAICEKIAEKLGVTLDVQDVDFNTILGAVASGKCQIGAAGITITDERKEQVDFSVPYATSKQYVIVKSDVDFTNIEDLKGKRIGVQLGTTGNFLISDEVDGTTDDKGEHVAGILEGSGATVSEYRNANIAATQLETDKLDAVVIDKLPAELIVKNYNGLFKCIELVYPDGSTTDETYGLCVKKGDTALMEIINQVLKELIDTGKIDEWIVYYSSEVTAD